MNKNFRNSDLTLIDFRGKTLSSLIERGKPTQTKNFALEVGKRMIKIFEKEKKQNYAICSCAICSGFLSIKTLANKGMKYYPNVWVCKEHIEEIINYLTKEKEQMEILASQIKKEALEV